MKLYGLNARRMKCAKRNKCDGKVKGQQKLRDLNCILVRFALVQSEVFLLTLNRDFKSFTKWHMLNSTEGNGRKNNTVFPISLIMNFNEIWTSLSISYEISSSSAILSKISANMDWPKRIQNYPLIFIQIWSNLFSLIIPKT